MGRPPLNVIAVTVHLPHDMPARIDAVVGKHGRSKFIREAVEHALRVAETALEHRDQRD